MTDRKYRDDLDRLTDALVEDILEIDADSLKWSQLSTEAEIESREARSASVGNPPVRDILEIQAILPRRHPGEHVHVRSSRAVVPARTQHALSRRDPAERLVANQILAKEIRDVAVQLPTAANIHGTNGLCEIV